MSDTAQFSAQVHDLYLEYVQAKSARARWAAEEGRLKDELLYALGYDPDDPKPVPVEVLDGDEPVFKVTVGTWKGLDQGYLKSAYPEVYAACERTRATKTIRAAG